VDEVELLVLVLDDVDVRVLVTVLIVGVVELVDVEV